jgi:hypothetical protein
MNGVYALERRSMKRRGIGSRNDAIRFFGGRLTENEFWSKPKPESYPSPCCPMLFPFFSFPFPRGEKATDQQRSATVFECKMGISHLCIGGFLSWPLLFQLGMCSRIADLLPHHSPSGPFVPSPSTVKCATLQDGANESCFPLDFQACLSSGNLAECECPSRRAADSLLHHMHPQHFATTGIVAPTPHHQYEMHHHILSKLWRVIRVFIVGVSRICRKSFMCAMAVDDTGSGRSCPSTGATDFFVMATFVPNPTTIFVCTNTMFHCSQVRTWKNRNFEYILLLLLLPVVVVAGGGRRSHGRVVVVVIDGPVWHSFRHATLVQISPNIVLHSTLQPGRSIIGIFFCFVFHCWCCDFIYHGSFICDKNRCVCLHHGRRRLTRNLI